MRRYLPKLASGEWLGCWSLTEPEAGSDAAGTRTHAEMLEDGEWVLNGSKTFTTNAHYADVCVAMAVTDRAAAQHGISAFLIDKGTPWLPAGEEGKQAGVARQRYRRGDLRELHGWRRRNCSAN